MADNKAAKPDNAKKPEEEKKNEKQPQVEELVSFNIFCWSIG